MKTHPLPKTTKRIGLALLWAGSVSLAPLWAQSIPDVQWSNAGFRLAVSTDGNIVTTRGTLIGCPARCVPGPLEVLKYSIAGDQIWSRTIGVQASALAATQDGGTVLAGYGYVPNTPSGAGELPALTKLSGAGGGVWTKEILRSYFFQTPGNSNTQVIFEDIVGTPDGGSLLLVTSAEPDAKTVVYVQKHDAGGNVQWTQPVAYPTPNPATPDRSLTRGKAVINAPDGGYLLAGYYNTSGDLNSPELGWVAKLDGQGNVVWHKLLNSLPVSGGMNGPVPGTIIQMQSVTDVILSADGAGYALVGTALLPGSVGGPPPSTALLELNLDGSFRRARSLNSTPSDAFLTRYQQYYAVGKASSQSGGNAQILLVNPAVRPLTDPALLQVVAQRVFDSFVSLGAIGTADDGGFVFGSSQLVKLKAEGLMLLAPTYNCATGQITFNTSGGDGTPVTYSVPGISRSSPTSNVGTVEPGLRADPKPIPIQATQSGITATYVFDLAAYCTTTPPPTGGPLTLLVPTYNCQTGAITFNTSGGDGTAITYSAPGISRPSPTSNMGTVESELRADPKTIPIQASQSGLTITYVFNLPGACGNARLAAPDEGADALRVVVLGNPVDADLTVDVGGASGQALRLDLVDGRGRLIGRQRIEQAGATERHTFDLRQQAPGLFVVRAVTNRQSQTVKVLKR